ncbi:MAG TPA: coenzyme F430 synthase [Methanosphaera sp.]|nr:coenzyme F430 synthase [Methanosphaera sp.]
MNKKDILISDANHGGLVLLEEYSKYTNNNLFFYDIYNKLSKSEKEEWENKTGVKFLSINEILEDEDSFIKINPVHMPPVIKTDYTHHEFVAYLLKKMTHDDLKIIQVTGVKGKTTVTTLLKHVLSNYNTLVLTSAELTYNNKILIEKLSITPASIITAIKKAQDMKILDDVDYCIFEVSLGVIPHGYINILTNIIEDYDIAKASSSASIAKESVFTSQYTICDFDAYKKYYSQHENVIRISFDDENADVYADKVDYTIKSTSFNIHYFDRTLTMTQFALSDFYVMNLLFAISTALIIGMDIGDISSNLESAAPIEGRNSFRYINDKLIIEDINPGLNTTSIKKCVENLKKYGEDYLIIVGGDYGITCEEIDEEKLCNFLKKINPNCIILTGELGYNLKKRLKSDCSYFKKLGDAIEYCENDADKKLIQIIYRSEYNSEIKYFKK